MKIIDFITTLLFVIGVTLISLSTKYTSDGYALFASFWLTGIFSCYGALYLLKIAIRWDAESRQRNDEVINEKSINDFFIKLSERATVNPKELKEELIKTHRTPPGQVQGLLASLTSTHPEFVKEVSALL